MSAAKLSLTVVIFAAIGFLIGIAKVGLYAVLDRVVSGPAAFVLTLMMFVGFAIAWFQKRATNRASKG